jgi:hypothetical protein
MTLQEAQIMMGYRPGWDLFAELAFIVAISLAIAFLVLMVMFPGDTHKKHYR